MVDGGDLSSLPYEPGGDQGCRNKRKRALAKRSYGSEAQVEVEDVLYVAHPYGGKAEQYGHHRQHHSRAIPVEEAAYHHHRRGRCEGTGGVQPGNHGPRQAQVVDDGVYEDRYSVGLTGTGHKTGGAGDGEDYPAVVKGKACD